MAWLSGLYHPRVKGGGTWNTWYTVCAALKCVFYRMGKVSVWMYFSEILKGVRHKGVVLKIIGIIVPVRVLKYNNCQTYSRSQ